MIWGSLVILLAVYVKLVVPDQFAGWGDFALLMLVQMIVAISTVLWAVPWSTRRPGHEWWRIPCALLVQGVVLIALIVIFSFASGALQWGSGRETFHVTIDNIWAVIMVLVPGVLMGLLFTTVRWGVTHQGARERLESQLRSRQESLDKFEQVWLQMELPHHLLFNSLSVVRYLATHDPQLAVKAMRTLGDLMKFYVSKRKEELIPIAEEMEQVRNLIQLYEYSSERLSPIEISLQADAARIQVLPMSILLLVENMCRYGDPDAEGRQWKLEISHREGKVEVRTENPVPSTAEATTEGLGTGILNLQNRLALQYGENQDFSITIEKNMYIVHYFFYLRRS